MGTAARALTQHVHRTPAAAAEAQPAVITMSDIDRPAGLAMLLWSNQSGGGRAFMCDPEAHCIDVIDPDTRPLFCFGGFGDRPGQFNEPSDVLVVPADELLAAFTDERALIAVADRGNDRVQLFEPDGVVLAVLSGKPSRRSGHAAASQVVELDVTGL